MHDLPAGGLDGPPFNAEDALRSALDTAFAHAPFYRARRNDDPGPGAPAAERLARLPILTKRELRAHMPKGFVHDQLDYRAALQTGAIELVTTSGTTEDRSTVLWHQPWWDASERAAMRLNRHFAFAWNGPVREAVLTTPLCAGNLCHVGDLSMPERTMGSLLFLNNKPDPTAWTTADMDRMLDELETFAPDLIEADPAYLARLSRHAMSGARAIRAPAGITLTYEFPSRLHRRAIHAAFPTVPVMSSYGSTETGHLLMECEAGRFHQNRADCHLEFVPLRAPAGARPVGRLLVSLLRHPWLSLLRFDIGDLVELADGPCPCGRPDGLPVAAIAGRVRDLTYATDGRAVSPAQVDAVMSGDASTPADPLAEYQIEQTGPAAFIARLAPDTALPQPALVTRQAALAALYGREARFEWRREMCLAPESSGKYRLAFASFAPDRTRLFAPEGYSQ